MSYAFSLEEKMTTCEFCHGTGKVPVIPGVKESDVCWYCEGTGKMPLNLAAARERIERAIHAD